MPVFVHLTQPQMITPPIFGELKDVRARGSEVWVSGWYQDTSTQGTYAGHWNGTGWDHYKLDVDLYPGASESGNAIILTSTDEWIVDDRVFWQRDGSSWIDADDEPSDPGLPFGYFTGAGRDGNLIAGGEYFAEGSGSTTPPLLRHFDGTTWDTVAFGGGVVENHLHYVYALDIDPDGNYWFGGFNAIDDFNTFWRGRVSDGGSTDSQYGTVYDCWARTASSVWVSGDVVIHHPETNQNIPTMEVQHWDGSAWASHRTALPVPPGGDLQAAFVYGIHGTGDSDVWGAGFYRESSYDNQRPLIVHWDGSSWTLTDIDPLPGDPFMHKYFYSIYVLTSDDIWAVGGAFTGGTNRMIAWHWDGSSWTDRSPT